MCCYIRRQVCISTSTSSMYYPRQWLLTVQIMVYDLLNYLSFLMSRQLHVVSCSVCALATQTQTIYFLRLSYKGKHSVPVASRYCRIGTLHCVLCLIVACGVIQVVLKKIAIVIRRTSKGNKVKIVARSFLAKRIRLNGMTRNFGRHSSSFGRNDSRATWPVSEWCISSYKLYRQKKGAVQYWDIMRVQLYGVNVT